MRRLVLGSALAAFALPCVLAAALLAQQQPTFRSGVDVVAVDVRVVDGIGRPVADLRPDEFAITVDGKPRTLVTADFVSFPVTADLGRPAPIPEPVVAPRFSSNAARPSSGRTIIIVVDEENIRAGYGKWAADATAAFVDRLQRNDRVGLYIPVSRINIAPTTEHAIVKKALGRVVGHLREAGAVLIDPRAQAQQMGPAEAFDRHYKNMSEGGKPGQAPTPPNPIVEAIVADVRQRAFTSLRSLATLLDVLRAEPGSKTVVLVSEELPVSDYIQERAEFNPEFARIAEAAAKAQASFYVLQLDRPVVDVDGVQKPSEPRDRDLRSFGLETVVSVTGGERFLVSGRAEPSLERVALEISGQYLLGFRSEPSDRDGKPHRIAVAVKRKGVEVRARQVFSYAAAEAVADRSGADAVNRALRAATVESGIPIVVATYGLIEPGGGSLQMRMIITAEIDHGATKEVPLTVGYTITDTAGRNAGAAVEQVTLKPAIGHPDGPLVYAAAALVPPGSYTLRLAAADGALRVGSVVHPFEARPIEAGPMRLSDFVVFDRYPAEPGKGRPSVSATVADLLSGYLVAYIAQSGGVAIADLVARLEIADSPDGPPRASVPMSLQGPDANGRLLVAAGVDVAALPPGNYIARAVFESEGKTLGRVTRPVRVASEGARPAAAVPTPQPVQPPAKPASQLAASPDSAVALAKPRTPAANVADLMSRVAAYIDDYAQKMLVVVGVEHYAQWLQREVAESINVRTAGSRAISTQLVAEFALVRNATDWDGYRNVYEVDGKPVPEAKDRFQRLFAQAPSNAIEQSRKITAESARYNMGALQRNFNVPTMALFFLTKANQGRFKFTKDKDDEVSGVSVWKVKFEETRKPTIIKTSTGKDMPVKGEAWIDPVDGRVLKTHMQIDSEMPLAASGRTTQGAEGTVTKVDIRASEKVKTTASITVTYAMEARLGLLVPLEMLETYEAPMRNRFSGEDEMTKISCRAIYSDFKRFETSGRLLTPR